MIFKPFIYLKIRHERKRWWDIWYPLWIAVGVVAIQASLRLDIQFVGADGILRQVNGLLGVLSGFYIASLTAISAIQSPSLNEKMAGDPPTLRVVVRKKEYKKELKRGEFLRYLFGYLSVASIVLFFVGIVIDLLYGPVTIRFPSTLHYINIVSTLTLFLYVFGLSNVILNTLIGVYYLTDRMHRAKNAGVPGKLSDQDQEMQEGDEN